MSKVSFPLRPVPKKKSIWSISTNSTENNQWTFGQVLPGVTAGSRVIAPQNKLQGIEAFVRGHDVIKRMDDQITSDLSKRDYEEWKLDGTVLFGALMEKARLIGLDLTQIAGADLLGAVMVGTHLSLGRTCPT